MKIPKPKRLQDWYKKMLDKAIIERVVIDYKVYIALLDGSIGHVAETGISLSLSLFVFPLMATFFD